LVDSGITSTPQLLEATPEQFLQIPGLGTTLAYQLYNELRTKTQNVPLSKLMAASTMFPNFGEKRARIIVNAIPDVLQRHSDPKLATDIQTIGGFGSLAYDFVNNLPRFVAWLKLHPTITLKEQIRSSGVSSLQGVTVVFSGFRDKNLEDSIAQRGGRVTTSVSKKTSIVVMKDINDKKGKAEQAISLGIPLISKTEFEMRYL
jgi:DNA ligase (NAD+)